jgi:UDP-N-acetylglucosamine 2-epimerase (non-hydrolysing)
MKRLLFVLGTRPETIKLFPVIRAARERWQDFEVRVCVTGQHREMVDPFLRLFDVRPDHDLAIMRPDQQLSGVVARVLDGLDVVLQREMPDWVLVQGDTSTAMAAALAAFHRRVPVAHVEAGLRTWDLAAPFPEEMNRQVVGRIASLHLAPTDWSRDNLLREGVPPDRVIVTGNTVVDALYLTRERHAREVDVAKRYPQTKDRRLMLVTGHRRENFGQGFEDFCNAIRRIVEGNPDVAVVYPVHLNPNVREPVNRILGPAVAGGRLVLDEPVDYVTFVALLDAAFLVLTDSGGVQEEAPGFGKPVLVTRDKTERPEGVEAGVVRLVGTDPDRIVAAVEELLRDPAAYGRMSRAVNPYGDGHAAPRVLEALASR